MSDLQDPRDLIMHKLFCVANKSSRWLTDCINERLPEGERRTEVSTSAYVTGRRMPSGAWVRACAEVLSLDPEELVEAFAARPGVGRVRTAAARTARS